MKTKLIIDNQAGITDKQALKNVQVVMSQGKISNDGKSYCWLTSLYNPSIDKTILVLVHENKKSTRFVVLEDKRKTNAD